MTKEQIAAQEARMAEMMKRMPLREESRVRTNAVMQMSGRKWESNKLPIFMLSVMLIQIMRDIYLKDTQRLKYTMTGVNCWTRRNQLTQWSLVHQSQPCMIAAAFMRAKKMSTWKTNGKDNF